MVCLIQALAMIGVVENSHIFGNKFILVIGFIFILVLLAFALMVPLVEK